MAGARYLVGIDLGTVNSAIAAVDLAEKGDPADALRAHSVPQLVGPGLVEERRLLPSSAYLPGPELAPGATRLPWGERPVVVGELAREQGARVPGRLVASAKSWLSHAKVDRAAAILPWGAPEGVPKLSPVQASALYLAHLRDAWNAGHPDAPLEAQEVVLTVPASFDAIARELTLAAAREAGLRPTLLEEPQAAFYDWAARHRADLAAALGGNRLVLVVDVGGGTTDLTLIQAEVTDGRPKLERVAVGDHLLLGGDNVDVALARGVEAKLGERLDASRWAALVQACRLAKEQLLAEGGPPRLPVAVVGRGSRLLGSAVSSELVRDEVRRVLLDGFFPEVGAEERPRRAARTAGLAELGLPYEADPAVTRHVAAFLARHAADVRGAERGSRLASASASAASEREHERGSRMASAASERERGSGIAARGMPRPDAILVNGGVFMPVEVRERLAAVVSSWFPGAPPVALLASPALDLAVARGAAYSALVRRGLGIRIGGGSPRAYYVGIAATEAAQALCVVPRHLEEGARVEVPRTFELALGRPVRFPLFASASARFERPGDVVPVTDDLAPLPPIATVLRSPDAPAAGRGAKPVDVPVRLEAALTEIGTLELWCVAKDRDARWKLEFQLRGAGAPASSGERTEVEAMPRRFDEARAQVELFYGKKAAPVERKEVKGLFRALEKILGPRDAWSTPVLRELWGALHAGQARRRRSPDHERLWLQLTGFCLRPGFGAPLDAWRAAETWKAFGEGLQYGAEPHGWQAWWILWRRIAGGLDAAAQARLFETVAPFLRPFDPRKPPKVAGVRPEAIDELIRLAGSLERIPPDEKTQAGEWLLARVEQDGPASHLLWALGRLGARVPFHGSANACVPASIAEEWIARLNATSAPIPRGELAFPLAQLARRSGDRARDVDDAVREDVARVLETLGAPTELVRMVREVVEASEAEERRIFGESLPPGLRLVDAGEAAAPAGGAPERDSETGSR
jgi:hypothetical protein